MADRKAAGLGRTGSVSRKRWDASSLDIPAQAESSKRRWNTGSPLLRG